MQLVLQTCAGGLYLLNKIFLCFAESAKARGEDTKERSWRIAAWSVYLAGLPFWIVILAEWHNWIAASVEASGAPAMFLGLLLAIKGQEYKAPKWLDRLALACIVMGFAYSLYDNRGLTTINQWLEIGLVTGYLIGTYLLANKRGSGYLWFVLMHVAAGLLLYIQHLPWLVAMQVVSLGFIARAYTTYQRTAQTRLSDAPVK